MTIKSIETILSELEAGGQLVRFTPYFDGDEAEKRVLFLARDIDGFVRGNQNQKATREYYGRVRAQLGEFVKGETVVDDGQTVKKLKPYTENVWELRVTFQPQARIFGAFATTDVFVALAAKFRDDLTPAGFTIAIQAVKDRWADMFGLRSRNPCWPLANCMCNVEG